MRIIADLHIHSRFSRACSRQTNIANLEKYARLKGLGLLGTGDFQHPKWAPELKQELTEIPGTGVYQTKTGYPFIYQTEISLVYTDGGKGRRVHHVIMAPSREVVEQITEMLGKKGRLDYDGRPIFNISSADFVEMMRSISEDIEIIPAHAWTPWFGVFGDKSGYDHLKDCFHDQTKHIHAIETGLSSDPPMNWRLSELDNINLVSFSDTHSFWPWRIGREATIFEVKELTYKNILKAIRTGEGLAGTIEFFPEEGKYHFDGHRNCGIVMSPKEALAVKKTCPKCGQQLTIGVAHRVEQLADRPEGSKAPNAKPYTNLIPLSELISAAIRSPVGSKNTFKAYYDLVGKFGNELNILLNAIEEELSTATEPKIVEFIMKNRKQQIKWHPGYDGEYGHPIFDEKEESAKPAPVAITKPAQKSLGDF
ncbi:MAG: endonuclease Q family protein [Candidatus Woesearchaeota archaeon]